MILRDQPIWWPHTTAHCHAQNSMSAHPRRRHTNAPHLSQPYSKVTQHQKSHHQLMVGQLLPELSDSRGKSSYVSYTFIQWKFSRFECFQIAMRDKFSASIIFQKVVLKALTVPVKCMSDFALEPGARWAAKDAIRWNREHDQLSPQTKS